MNDADSRGEFAPAKVNLFLHVVGRRADGYHVLDSLVVFAGIGDVVEAEPAAELSLAISGPFGAALFPDPSNLVLRAAGALIEAASIRTGARLRLTKNLPVASGIGGGSTDAAATLRLLARMWAVSPEAIDFPALALALGADVPVCLAGRPARMGGIGERIGAAPRLPPFGLLLVNPGLAVTTADVFHARQAPFSAPAALPAAWSSADRMADDLATLRNDLDQPAIALYPVIAEVLAAIAGLPGC
ncbi:MAG: 4-(cytidine 5'-diphospho)-2-C-methyl-D-erythritol kinase, partial [Acetobacteraceae bacterium]